MAFNSGQTLPSATLEGRIVAIEALKAPPLIIVRQSVGTPITNGAWVGIPFDFEETDTGNWHSTTANTSRITPPAGWYHVDAAVAYSGNATGLRAARLQVNGFVSTGRSTWLTPAPAGFATTIPVSGLLRLNGIDFVELYTYQGSGATLNTLTPDGTGPASILSMYKVADY